MENIITPETDIDTNNQKDVRYRTGQRYILRERPVLFISRSKI
jgi:hypothetical protein